MTRQARFTRPADIVGDVGRLFQVRNNFIPVKLNDCIFTSNNTLKDVINKHGNLFLRDETFCLKLIVDQIINGGLFVHNCTRLDSSYTTFRKIFKGGRTVYETIISDKSFAQVCNEFINSFVFLKYENGNWNPLLTSKDCSTDPCTTITNPSVSSYNRREVIVFPTNARIGVLDLLISTILVSVGTNGSIM